LPVNAGLVSLTANLGFNWAADLRLEGGMLDLSMPSIEVVANADATGADGKVSADSLSKSKARSVLLGGKRTANADGSGYAVETRASRVDINADLSTGEVLAAATDAVAVGAGVTVASTAAAREQSQTLTFTGAGAALAVSDNLGLSFKRTVSSAAARTGTLDASQGAFSGAAVLLDGSGKLSLSGATRLNTRSLDLSTSRIVLSQADRTETRANTLNLAGAAALGQLNQLSRLRLRAIDAIEFADAVSLGQGLRADGMASTMDRLTLDAAAIRGQAGVVKLAAQQVVLANSSGLVATEADKAGGGALAIQAQPAPSDLPRRSIVIGQGQQYAAFDQVKLDTTADVVFDGQASLLSTQGDVNITADRVTATTTTTHGLAAAGELTIARPAGLSEPKGLQGLGASVALSAKRIVQGGRIDLASGQLSLSASGTGLTSVALEAGSVPTTAQLAQAQVDRSAIVFAQGSVTDVSGRQVTNVGGWSTSTAGGSISAQAVAGDVLVNGLLNVSAGMQGAQSDAAKSAGQIKLAAAAGQVVLEQSAALKGTASTAAQSGRLVVDAGSVVQGAALSAATNAAAKASQGTLDTLATLAREGGLQREFNVRVRRGDQSLNTQVQAIRTLIAADGGKLDLNAQANIQASAPQGGLVQLSAKNDVTLNGATINANSTRVGANGGDVMMNSTDGVVHAEGAASISATGDDALDGRVLMVSNDEALLKLADAAFANGVTATPKATAKIAAAEVAVVGNHVFEGQSLDGAADAVTGTVRKDAVTKVATVTKTLTTITGTGANRKTTIKQTVTTTPSTYTEVYRKNEATGLFELVLTSDTLVGASSTVTTTLANNRAFVSTDKAGTVTAPTTVALSVQSSGEVQTVALNDLTLTADALTRRASDVLQALSLADSVKVRGGVELQAKGADFVLNDALALNDHRSGGQPLFLTIRSDQNIRINAELSDGFASLGRANTSSATATPTPTALVAGDAASFRLVAGADLGASNMLATQAGAAADLLLGAKALVRTTSGSIELAAARNIELQSDYSDATKTTFSQARVYVAGRPVEGTSSTVSSTDADSGLNTSTTTTVASKVTDAWASFTFHGGRLGAQAGQDILAAGDQQGINNWFDHVATYVQDNEGNSQLSHVAWWSALDAVKQGLGSFGGGNVEVNAGRDIRNLSVWAPTARDVVSTDITTTVFDADGNAMDTSTRHVGDAASVLNGGDITVRAGRDVLGGQYFLGRGLGQVSAGRDLGNGSLVGAPNASAENRSAVLGQMDGDWMVESGRNLTLGLAFNPTLGTTSKRLGTDASGSTGAYVTYGDTSQLSLSSAAGDLIYKTDDWINAYASLVRADYNTGNDQTSASKDSIKYFSYLAAPVVHLAATAGGVTFKPQVGATGTATATASAGLYLMPSAKGDLSIDSAKDLVLSTVVLSGQMLAAALPTMAAPLSAADLYGTVNPFASQVQNPLLNEASNPSQLNSSRIYSDLLHEQDTVPARISAGQDIKNGGVTARLVSTKPARITAGRDILLNNLDLVVQNFDAADISLVSAGRNILGGTTSGVNLGVIRLHGAGNLRVEAGRQLTLGNSSGLESQGNLFNTALPDAGGSITAKSGVNKTLDVDAFVGKYLGDDASRAALVADVASRMNLTGSLSFDQALAYWRGMSSASQRAFADALLAERFKNAYLPAGSAFLAQWQAAAAAAGTQANDFKSLAFQRFKDEVIYSEVARLGALASVISDSENPTENAKRKAQRNAIWSQADALVGLAGWGEGFNFKGDIELTASKIQTFGSGAFNQGGLNLMAPGGQVVVGLSALSAADRKDEVASKRGLITKDGGSIRVFTDLDFQVNAQKAFVVGQGDLMVFSQQGSIDSGRGSNTDVSPYTPQYKRLLDGSVVRVANNGTTGSGIGVLPNANGVADGAVKLYAPRGEVKALDAFIRGPEIEIASPKVLGADNLKGSVSGVAAAPTVGFALSPTTGVKDDAASGNLKEVASAQEAKKKQSSSLVTVDVVSLGDSAAPTAAGTPEAAPCTTPDCRKSKSGATP
jgi:filamentous hemagglutinin